MTDTEHIQMALASARTAWRDPSAPIRHLTHCFLPGVARKHPEYDPDGSGLVRRHATMLTSGRLAAYVAPGVGSGDGT